MKSFYFSIGFLLLASLIVISSVSQRMFLMQLGWMAAGLLVMYLVKHFDWRAVLNYEWLVWGFYGFALLLVLVARFFAPLTRNTHNWIMFGPVQFQPVEFVKIALILVYAQYFSRRHLAVARWRNIITSFVIFAVPAAIVLSLPDMGSTVILFGIWFGFLLVSGLPLRRIAIAVAVFVLAGIAGWHFVLKPYQKERILGVFYPNRNTLTYNYQVIQSKIAIGSAGFFGKGYGQGSQVQLGFLSEPTNDFVFASLTEEWGILGAFLVVAAFCALVYSTLLIALRSNQNFEKFVCLGVALVFGIQFLMNAGQAVALFPVVGVTFPLLSYGGSSLLSNFLLLSFINNIRARNTVI